MLGRVRRAWQSWGDKSRLVAPLWIPPPGQHFAPTLQFPELMSIDRANGPELETYLGLAEFWDEYTSVRLPDYPTFLDALARRSGASLHSVLDLACGTGILTTQLAGITGEVLGLDASERMLEFARKRDICHDKVSFVRGDFRDFALGRDFDLAVCASNSLNYVADRGELRNVFASVGNHLRPGGLFVFDTTSERTMRNLSGNYLHSHIKGQRFAIQFVFDAIRRKETARAILPSGVEVHRRIPLGPAEVYAAVKGTGLEVMNYFSSAFWPKSWGRGLFYIFLLTRRV